MEQKTLVAFGAERRLAAVCLFQNSNLIASRVRHLAIQHSKAADSVREMVARALEDRKPDLLAIAKPPANCSARTIAIIHSVKGAAKDAGVLVAEVDDASLLMAYAHPPLKSKQHLRKVGRSLWPSLTDSKSSRAVLDAALAGLYIQVERQLAAREVTS